jgi:hypothetical protein
MLSGLQSNTLTDDIFIVMDALDECENTEAVETILRLLKQIETITTARVRVLVTSRPEIPIIAEFSNMSNDLYQDIQLEVAQAPSIRSDLLVFFKDEFSKIRKKLPARNIYSSLPLDWSGSDMMNLLVDKAHPLFIVASAVCRQISEAVEPQAQLSILIAQQHSHGMSSGLAGIYLPILEQAASANTQQARQNNLLAI